MKRSLILLAVGLLFFSSCTSLPKLTLTAPSSLKQRFQTTTSLSIVYQKAAARRGEYYRPGQPRQCANWVASVVKSAGYTPPKGYPACKSWKTWGRLVTGELKKGDVVLLKNTYKWGVSHIGIYYGDGYLIHRPTKSAPVRVISLSYYKNGGKYWGARRAH